MPKKQNALTLHNYFANLYQRQFKQAYYQGGKGLELTLLKRLMDKYDYYQIMYVMDKYMKEAVSPSIKGVYDAADEWIMEYAYDPLIAKARFAINNAKGEREMIKEAMYLYMDLQDAWMPVPSKIEKAAEELQSLLAFLD